MAENRMVTILALFYTTELLEEEIRVMLFILIILKIEHLK